MYRLTSAVALMAGVRANEELQNKLDLLVEKAPEVFLGYPSETDNLKSDDTGGIDINAVAPC